MDFLNFNSVETLPGYEARAAFTVNSSSVFREDVDIVPNIVDDTLSYIPWDGDNQMPFDLLALVEKDEHWQPANASTPRSATDPARNTASPKPPLPSRVPSRTSLLTTTSPLISSAFRRNSLGRALRLLRGQALWLRRVSTYSQRERFAHRPYVEKGSLLLSLHPG